MYKCDKCNNEFKNKSDLSAHLRYNKDRTVCVSKKYKKIQIYSCNFCNREFEFGNQLGGHKACCKHNPNSKIRLEKVRQKAIGRPLSEEHKKKTKETINKKIKDGTWHNSFSKSRTHEYKGIKFHGTWELNYAKWLDTNGKKWRRVSESFEYIFGNKKRRYTPDFYLFDEKCYIEIKGYETEKDRSKWEQFPFKLKILKGNYLKDLGIISSYRVV